MPELRQDPVVGFWTIISTERSRRPVEFAPREIGEERSCPFCEGKESSTPPESFAIRREGTLPNAPGWDVRAFLSKTPILIPVGSEDRCSEGIYDSMGGVGLHELVIESPHHIASIDELETGQIVKVLQVYAQRINQIEKDERFKYTLLFKNHGIISGSAKDILRHTRSQLMAMPVTPKRVKEELASTRRYYEKNKRCVFCDILLQETREGVRVVEENDSFLAFCPYASRSPFEIWILPKTHSPYFGKLGLEHFDNFARVLKSCLSKIKKLLNDPPYNYVLHSAPYGRRAQAGYWDTIEQDYHWYFQVSPRLTHDAGFEWGTGVHINPTPPEEAAKLLKQTTV